MKNIILFIIGIFYTWFLYRDFSIDGYEVITSSIKYLSIVLCFFLSFLKGERYLSKYDILLLRLGLFFTVLADLSLVILDKVSLGVSFFCIVQIIYCHRYDGERSLKLMKRFLLMFLFILIIYFNIYVFVKNIDFLILLSLFYAICLITSVIKASKAYMRKSYPVENRILILWGMVFFLLCDINVAAYNMGRFINYPEGLGVIANNKLYPLIWYFYLPSQVMISLSGYLKV